MKGWQLTSLNNESTKMGQNEIKKNQDVTQTIQAVD